MDELTARDRLASALAFREVEFSRDLADATRAWGASDPGTQRRARRLAGVRAAIREGRPLTRAEFSGDDETKAAR